MQPHLIPFVFNRIISKTTMERYENRVSMKKWAEEDRPREKLQQKGRNALSDAELIAILIGTGTKNESALDLAKNILRSAGENLIEVSKLGVHELLAISGVGPAKAVTLIAALELGRRRNESEVLTKEKITCSQDAFSIFRSVMGDYPYEAFWIILLNKANKVIRKSNISEGGISGTVVDPKKIYKVAIDHHASSIILGHNHPSGNLQPSEADHKITKKIRDAGTLLDIAVLDHLIIGEDGYYSFADSGML
jgi:DNA repair protein RadC